MMKMNKENTAESLGTLAPVLTVGGMEVGKELEVYTSEDTAVILKKQMTAMELVKTIQNLKTLASDLLVHLTKTCEPCRGCKNGCPYMKEAALRERFQVPENLLEWAGIPADAKLDIFAEDGEICIMEAAGQDLRDVPLDLLEMFREAGICLDTLDDLLTRGDVVYGG